MKKSVVITFLLFVQMLYGQDIFFTSQRYYCYNKSYALDTIYSLKYAIRNTSVVPKVIMFTEDDISDLSIEKNIRRKCFRKYGDFSLASFAWDNMENMSTLVLVPDFFVRIINPNEEFIIMILVTNSDATKIDSEFRKHLLLCNLSDIDNKKMIWGFASGIKENNVEYPYNSVSLAWEQIVDFLNRNNKK